MVSVGLDCSSRLFQGDWPCAQPCGRSCVVVVVVGVPPGVGDGVTVVLVNGWNPL